MSWISDIARPEIVALKPYEHASWEPHLERLHANELPWRADRLTNSEAGLNRYPEPQPRELVATPGRALWRDARIKCSSAVAAMKPSTSSAAAFCRAGQDAVMVCPPTFGMYSVAARIQGADVVTVPLKINDGFALDEDEVLRQCTPNVKLRVPVLAEQSDRATRFRRT